MSVNARVQAIFVIFRLTYAVVNLTSIRRNKTIIINKVNPGKISRIIEEVELHLIGILIIGESLVIFHTLFNCH